MKRLAALALLPLGAALGIGAPLAQTAPAAAEGVTINVKVTDLRNAKGIVRACMTSDEGKFPRCRGVAGAHGARSPSPSRA
jgi:uncharacterized protein (DUF2141 family)